MRRGRRNGGFTLIEILLAVAILCLITLVVGSSVGLGLRAWDKGEAEVDRSQRARVLVDRLSQQLKSAYPYQAEADGKKSIAFVGRPASLWFVTVSPRGFKWASYYVKDGLLLYREGVMPDKIAAEKVSGEGEVLDPKASGVQFVYFSTGEGRWMDSWDSERTLPGAVRIKVADYPRFVVSLPLGSKEREQK
jgi:prepilin-type N-terminal cleavage/methylation domain-containing protein